MALQRPSEGERPRESPVSVEPKRPEEQAVESGPTAGVVLGLLLVAYGGGLVGVPHSMSGVGMGLVGALSGALALGLLFVSRDAEQTWGRGLRLIGRFALALLLAMVAGGLRMEGRLTQAEADRARAEVVASQDRGGFRRIEATVEGRSERRWGVEVALRDVSALDDGSALPRRLLLGLSGSARRGRAHDLLWSGSRVQLVVRVEPLLFSRNPGNPDRERAAAIRGFGARARLVDPDWVLSVARGTELASGVRATSSQWRSEARDAIAGRLSADVTGAGLARALVLGDRRGLDLEATEAFRALGLSHLIAISGLHVGIVVSLALSGVSLLGQVSRRSRRASGARSRYGGIGLIGLAVVAYAWLAGAGPSVLRAALAVLFLFVARKMGRDLTPMAALCLIGWIGVAIEPALALDLGAELSFAACAGILVVVSGSPREFRSSHDPAIGFLARNCDRLYSAARQGMLVSLAASFATAPLLEQGDLPLALVGPVANLLAVPLLAAIVLPASVGAVVFEGIAAGCEAGAISGILSPLAWVSKSWLLAPVAAFESSVRALSGFVMEAPGFAPPMGGSVVGPLTGFALTGMVMARCGRLGASALLWGLVWLLSGGGPAVGRGDLADLPRFVFVDVGQGDATLIQTRDATVLVDAGGGRPGPMAGAQVVRTLHSLGVTRLDRLVVTHGDADHRAGAPSVLEAFEVGALWLPQGAEQDPRLIALAELARVSSVPVEWVAAGRSLRLGEGGAGEVGLEVLWPMPGASNRSSNDGSLVLSATTGGVRALLTADVGAQVERRLISSGLDLTADVLKIGHHGSRHSTLPEFLDAIRPSVAVVSAPCRPHRGLPHARVLAALENREVALRWTGRSGAISIGPDRRREPAAAVPGFRAASGRRYVAQEWGRARSCRAAD